MEQKEDAFLSVVICTHNPNIKYLERVLDCLKSQSLPQRSWELLLVDNASKVPVASQVDLTWHSQGRHIREAELGLTPARLRGIADSVGEVIIFVDDDNLLSSNYLEQAMQIAHDNPKVGAWGGAVEPSFEVSPPTWTKPYWGLLAIRTVDQDRCSTDLEDYDSQPCGAGMCVRRVVALKYLTEARENPLKIELDRKGDSLASCGDSDLAQTSVECGLEFGVFRALHLVHLIPSRRLEEDYLLKLMYSITFSSCLLDYIKTGRTPRHGRNLRSMVGHIYRLLVMPQPQKKFYQSKRTATRLAATRIQQIQNSGERKI